MRVLLCLTLTALLSGCSTTWYKEGATQSEFEHDKAQCTADAYQQFPVSNVSNAIGQPTTTPMLTTCQSSYGATSCMTTGGQVQPAPTITYDANGGARGAAFKACMYERGYSTEAPRPTETTSATSARSNERYPTINETAANSKNAATPGRPITEFLATGVCEKLVVGGNDLTKQSTNSLRRTIYPNGWNAIRVETNGGEAVLFSTRPEVVVSPELSSFDVETLGVDAGKGQGVSFVAASGRCQILYVQNDKKFICKMRAERDGRTIELSFRFSRWTTRN